ncbi:MAG: hypothetical protein LBE22_11690 [Azoarcus sp.]|jgi:hypothetical protein|nr:hypothetical protein [Azoarcus sp.]
MTEQIPTVAPEKKYSMAFFDAQNLYQHAKEAFYDGIDKRYTHPSFDPKKLHTAVAESHGYTPTLTRFYSGIPHISDNEMWGGYWNNRVLALKRSGVNVTTRKLRYHKEDVGTGIITIPQEKGVDIRIALDLMKCTMRK